MAAYVPVTPERHGAKRWLRVRAYGFARPPAVVPVVAAEMTKLAAAMPTGILTAGDSLTPVAVLSPDGGRNAFVGPDEGWLADYVPAAFRAYPFRLAVGPNGAPVLCVDEDSGLVTDGPDGEAFFEEEGRPSKALRDIVRFLRAIEEDRRGTLEVAGLLQQYGLLSRVGSETSGGAQYKNLLQINQDALRSLTHDQFVELQRLNGLAFAYCQVISMQQWPKLNKLAELAVKLEQRKAQNVSSIFTPTGGGEIDIDWSQFKA